MKPPNKNIFALEPSNGQKTTLYPLRIPMGLEIAEIKVYKQTNKQINKQTDIFVFI